MDTAKVSLGFGRCYGNYYFGFCCQLRLCNCFTVYHCSAMNDTWYLYLIECKGGKLYTGITVDLRRRFQQHCVGKGAKYTRLNPPLQMIAAKPIQGRSSATKAEIAMKRLKAPDKRLEAATWPLQDNLPCQNSIGPALTRIE